MALTELQLPEKAAFYRNIRGTSDEVKRYTLRWTEIADFIATMDTADMDAMSIPSGQVRTDLIAFRTSLNNIVTAIEAEYATLDKVRSMAIL